MTVRGRQQSSEARYRHARQNTSNEHQSGTNPSKTKKSSMYVSPSRSNDLVHSSAASPPKNGPSDIRLSDSSKYFRKLNSTITADRSTFLAASAARRTTIPKSLETFIVIDQRQACVQDCLRFSPYGRVSELAEHRRPVSPSGQSPTIKKKPAEAGNLTMRRGRYEYAGPRAFNLWSHQTSAPPQNASASRRTSRPTATRPESTRPKQDSTTSSTAPSTRPRPR